MFKTLTTIKPLNQLNLTKSTATSFLINNNQDSLINYQSVRHARGIKPWKNGPIEMWKKHIYNYEYRKGRAKKVLKIQLPDFDKDRNRSKNVSVDEMKSELKERGVVLNRQWLEKPIHIDSSGTVIDEFVPAEGDGKESIISKEGASQRLESVKGRGKDLWASRKLRKYLETFEPQEWAQSDALAIYIKTNQALADGKDMDYLATYVTDHCLPSMIFNAELKTIKWKYVKTIELPRVVNIKVDDKQGVAFGQITVRFHSQQTLAIYDQFGRLISGSEAILKDVLEYIVFENKISSLNGTWRIHAKIVPAWLQQNSFSPETTIKCVEQLEE